MISSHHLAMSHLRRLLTINAVARCFLTNVSSACAMRIALHCAALCCIALPCIALHWIASPCIALHHNASHRIALHCIALLKLAGYLIRWHCTTSRQHTGVRQPAAMPWQLSLPESPDAPAATVNTASLLHHFCVIILSLLHHPS